MRFSQSVCNLALAVSHVHDCMYGSACCTQPESSHCTVLTASSRLADYEMQGRQLLCLRAGAWDGGRNLLACCYRWVLLTSLVMATLTAAAACASAVRAGCSLVHELLPSGMFGCENASPALWTVVCLATFSRVRAFAVGWQAAVRLHSASSTGQLKGPSSCSNFGRVQEHLGVSNEGSWLAAHVVAAGTQHLWQCVLDKILPRKRSLLFLRV
jgi:hypothetical protein